MGRITVTIPDKTIEKIEALRRDLGITSTSQYINYLIGQSLPSDKKNKKEPEADNEPDIALPADTDMYGTLNFKFKGETAYEIRLRAKELGLSATQYLVMCHKHILPINIEYDTQPSYELGQNMDRLVNSIQQGTDTVLSILKYAYGKINQNDISIVEDNQNNILKELEEIKQAFDNYQETHNSSYKSFLKETKKYLRSKGTETQITKTRK